jgi:murein DD-endopeptidase MepM/ murein hydrolase activator NlpD
MIEVVVLHPPVAEYYGGFEHADGELAYPGDALGVDVVVGRLVDGWTRFHAHDGTKNEDWYGWGVPLLAPTAGIVESIRINEETNMPGELGNPPASAITFLAPDGLRVVYAHVQDVQVSVGDEVKPGDVVARIGNNGMCRNPHVHVGAWREEQPLQIRFDLAALARARRALEEASGD